MSESTDGFLQKFRGRQFFLFNVRELAVLGGRRREVTIAEGGPLSLADQRESSGCP